MTLLGSVDIPFTKSTKIAVDATDTAGQAATVAQQATDTAGQAQATAQTASQTATQAAATAADAAQAAQTAITTANGKNKAYYGATTPANPQSGDIWFVEDDSNNVTAIKHYDGTQWITDVDNIALEQQISAAQAAADNAATVGQAAQQTAADAEAKGDAAAKAAEEAKDAATKAQSDASSAVTSANNAVDTANTAKQVASDAATQASTAKTNAQTAMSNAQDAINQAKAANDNANTREKSIIKSNAAPSNPATDQLWIDTSKTPQIMRRWNGSTWVDLSPTQASQIGAVSTTTYTTDISNINNTLSQKASVTTVNTLSGRVDEAETAITQNANNIALKADKNVVDTLKNTVDNHSTLISQNADAIALKASQSTVDALTGRVSTAEATLKTQADQIAARITKTDADAKYATQTALTATADSLTSSISAVQTNLDNLQIGGKNLVLNSTFKNGTSQWSNVSGYFSVIDPESDKPSSYILKGSRTGLTSNGYTSAYSNHFSANVGDTFTFSLDFKVTDFSVYADMPYPFIAEFYDSTGNRVQYQDVSISLLGLSSLDNNKWYRVSYTIAVTKSSVTSGGIRLCIFKNGEVSYREIKVEKGNKATDWTPAPEDMATASQITQLANDINLRVKKGDVINQINVSTEGVLIDGKKVHITGQTTIDNAVIKDAMIDSISANKLTAGTIDANVITVKNINASNIVTGTLDASKATVTNIDASKITTGTLNAARIASGSIDASKLSVSSLSALSANLGSVTAGSISGVNINIGNGNFTVDTAGNLVAKNANITGTINATSGSFSGKVTGSTIEGSSFDSYGENGEIHVSDDWIESFRKISDTETNTAIISSGNVEQYYRVSSTIYKESDLSPGYLYIYDTNSGETTIDGAKITAGNIVLNGAHSIITNDGGQLYFTNSGGSRVDISAANGNFNQRVNPNNMRIGYHTFEVSDGSALYFTDSSGNYSYSPKAKSWATSSKFEWKQDFQAIKPQDMLEIIKKTNVVQFKYKADVQAGRDDLYTGFVIGGGYQTPDEFLNYDRDGIDTYKVTGVLTGAVQELSARDESNKERLSIIEEQNKNLLLKIADLEARLAKLEA